MAKKKVTKKAVKKATKKVETKVETKKAPACSVNQSCHCQGFLAIIIIALTWWKPASTWSQITITIIAAIILLSGNNCFCKR